MTTLTSYTLLLKSTHENLASWWPHSTWVPVKLSLKAHASQISQWEWLTQWRSTAQEKKQSKISISKTNFQILWLVLPLLVKIFVKIFVSFARVKESVYKCLKSVQVWHSDNLNKTVQHGNVLAEGWNPVVGQIQILDIYCIKGRR